MLNVVIIDDEIRAVKSIDLALKNYCPDVNVIGKAYSAKEGIHEIINKKPNLVFLDIRMPFMNGIELLESLPNREFDVIFITGYSDYAIKAFKLNAIDYLLKPLNVLELVEAVKRVKEYGRNYPLANQKLHQLTKTLTHIFPIASVNGTEFLKLREIIRFRADGSYSKVHSTDGKVHTISRNLKEVEEEIESNMFFRIHKSHLINLEHIKKIAPHKDGGTITMCDDSIVEIARSRKAEFMQVFNQLR